MPSTLRLSISMGGLLEVRTSPFPNSLRCKLQEVLGAEAAADLVSQIESMTTIREDLNELRHEMQSGFARVDTRFARLEGMLEGRFQAVDSKLVATESRMAEMIENGLREQTRFFFLAWAVLIASNIALWFR